MMQEEVDSQLFSDNPPQQVFFQLVTQAGENTGITFPDDMTINNSTPIATYPQAYARACRLADTTVELLKSEYDKSDAIAVEAEPSSTDDPYFITVMMDEGTHTVYRIGIIATDYRAEVIH